MLLEAENGWSEWKNCERKSFCYGPDLSCWVHTMGHCIKPLQSAVALLGLWLFCRHVKWYAQG